jgi:hypothetical protein
MYKFVRVLHDELALRSKSFQQIQFFPADIRLRTCDTPLIGCDGCKMKFYIEWCSFRGGCGPYLWTLGESTGWNLIPPSNPGLIFARGLVMHVRDGTGTGYRPVTGRPARVLRLKFCLFHVKIYKTSVGSREYLPDNKQYSRFPQLFYLKLDKVE